MGGLQDLLWHDQGDGDGFRAVSREAQRAEVGSQRSVKIEVRASEVRGKKLGSRVYRVLTITLLVAGPGVSRFS